MLTTIAAIAGLIFGASGLTLGILNYRRDRPGLLVTLEWDAILFGEPGGPQARMGQIYITNIGRRPIYITAAGIELNSTKSDWAIRRTTQGKLKGRKLSEGDPPLILVVEDSPEIVESLKRDHAIYWHHIRAFAETSTGKRYLSSRFFNWKRPWWGMGDGKVKLDETVTTWIIECELERHQLEADMFSGKKVLVGSEDFRNLKRQVKELEEAQARGEAIEVPDDLKRPFSKQILSTGIEVYSRKKPGDNT